MATETFSFEEGLGPTAARKPLFVPASRTAPEVEEEVDLDTALPATKATGSLPKDSSLRKIIADAARKYNVPEEYGLALAEQESSYNPAAKNTEFDAAGLFQFIPDTARRLGIDPLDPTASADAAMKEFATQMKQGGADWAIKHHFAGPDTKGHGPKTRQYLADVRKRADDIRALLGGDAGEVGGSSDAGPKPSTFSFEDALGGQRVRPPEATLPEDNRGFLERSGDFAMEALDKSFQHVKNRFLTDIGQIPVDSPDYTPRKGAADPFAEVRDTRARIERRQRGESEAALPAKKGFWANIENPVKLLTSDSLPANALETIMAAPEQERARLTEARKVMQQEKIAANPEQYPTVAVQAAKDAIAQREAKQDPDVKEMWTQLKKAFAADPGAVGAQFANALLADPYMLLAPEGIGLKVAEGTKALATGTAAGRVARIADRIIDAGSTGAALNLAVDEVTAASEGRDLTAAEAGVSAVTGGVLSAALAPFARGAKAKEAFASGKVTKDTLEQALRDAAAEEVASEAIVNSTGPIAKNVKHQIEESTGIKFESDNDLKQYLQTARKEWKQLFADRDLNGQYQKALAEERISRAETLRSEAEGRRQAREAEAKTQREVEEAYAAKAGDRTARFQQEFEAALAAREAGDLDAELRLQESAQKLDEQEILDAAFEGEPQVRDAMLRAAQRDSKLATPKWQRGEVDPRLLGHLGIGSLFAGTAYALAPEQKEKAAFAAGLAGLILPKGGRVLDRLRQSGSVSLEGDIIGLLAKEGKLKLGKSADEIKARDAELINMAKRGDQRAFSELYKEHFPRIQRYVKSFVRDAGPKLGVDAEDVAQEAMVKAFQSLDKFEGSSQFTTWLHSIARNEGLQAIRDAKTLKGGGQFDVQSAERADVKTPFGESYTRDAFDEGVGAELADTPEAQLERQQAEQSLVNAIQKLPERDRQVFVLSKIEQLSGEEIAEITGLSHDNIRQILSRSQAKVLEGVEKGLGANKVQASAETSAAADTFMRGSKTPPVLYHGGVANIDKFKGGTFFADKEGAKAYADYRHTPERPAVLYAVEVNIKNPADEDAVEAAAKKVGLKEQMLEAPWQYLTRGVYKEAEVDAVIAQLKKEGYDGAHFETDYRPESEDNIDSWVPFEDSQIRKVEKRGRGRPRKQAGEVDPALLKTLGIITLGAGGGLALEGMTREKGDKDIGTRQLVSAIAGAGSGLLLFGAKGAGIKRAIKTADDLLGASSTRIFNKSPAIHRKVLTAERKILEQTHEHLSNVDPFLKKLNKLPQEGRDLLTRALMTGKGAVIDRILNVMNDAELTASYKKVRQSLDSIGDKLVNLKRFERGNIEYFPRIVKDKEGLFAAIGKEEAGNLQKIIQDANVESLRKHGRPLSEIEESAIINQALFVDKRGTQPGFTKQRGIEEITPELQKFYASPEESLHSYIRDAVQDIEAANFFGGSARNMKRGSHEFLDVDRSVKNLMADEVKSGKLSDDDAHEIADILRTRFKEGLRGENDLIRNIKNIGNIGLLGNFFSAATQLADVGTQVYVQGLKPTLESVARQVAGKKMVDVKDFGLVDHISEEFAGQLKTSRWLNKIFRATLFAGIDQFGKNTALNAAIIKAKSLASTDAGVAKLANKYADSFGPDFNKLVSDLKGGKITELTKDYAFMELSRTQPISRIEMPQAYLKHPNLRSYLWLKSFAMKQLDLVRRDAYNEMKKGNVAKGLKNLAEIGVVLGMSGATTEAVKDFMLGRDVSLKGSDVLVNMFKTFGFSEYIRDQFAGVSKEEAAARRKAGDKYARAKSAQPISAIASAFAPPFRVFDQLLSGDPRAMRYLVPFIGPYMAEQVKKENELRNSGGAK